MSELPSHVRTLVYTLSNVAGARPADIYIDPWYLHKIVAQNMLRTYEIKLVFSRKKKKIGFYDYFAVTKCLQHIEIPDLLSMCAPCSELPSNISTMHRPIYTRLFLASTIET